MMPDSSHFLLVMRFLADENLPASTIRLLEAAGHEVIRQAEPALPDELVISKARNADAVLLSQDKDIGDLIFRDRVLPPAGAVLFRFDTTDLVQLMAERLLALLTDGLDLVGQLTVITPEHHRQRRFP